MCVLQSELPRDSLRWASSAYYSGDEDKVESQMATQSMLESFNPTVESIEDYKERFDFYCTAHQIPEARHKALFLT